MTQPPLADNRRSLALATTELSVGGAERCLTNVALGLAGRGWSVQVYSLRQRPADEQAALVRRLEAAQVPLHFLNLRGWFSLPGVLRRFQLTLARQQPALLQTFLFHANVAGAWVARRAGVRRLAIGLRVRDPRRARDRLERWAARRADAVICVSQAVAEHAQSALGVRPTQQLVIPNGIDVARYRQSMPTPRESLGLPADARVLLSIGRLDRQKGFDWLLQFAPSILAERPRHHWVIVGAGPEHAALLEQARQRGIADRVHLAGWRPPDELPDLLAASDLVLIPSRWEGMPNVLLEAMAAARPVVVTDVEGVREVLGTLAPAQLVTPGDDAGFRERVLKLTADAAAATELGEQNRRQVDQHYSLTAMIDRYETCYEALLAEQSSEND